jgi:hypothetical protein
MAWVRRVLEARRFFLRRWRMNEQVLVWPDRPRCHDADGYAQRFEKEWSWRPARGGDRDSPYDYPFRTCSYCGSMHPEDLLNAVRAGATLGGADWKYGWPHKFYVELPNPAAGQLRGGTSTTVGGKCVVGRTLDEVKAEHPQYADWEWRFEENLYGNGPGYRVVKFSPAPAQTHAKFYNEHLKDLEPATFAVVAELLKDKAGIRFELDAGRLRYAAPCHNYQR